MQHHTCILGLAVLAGIWLRTSEMEISAEVWDIRDGCNDALTGLPKGNGVLI